MKSVRKQLGKYALPVVVIAQLFVIIGMMTRKSQFTCLPPNPMSGAVYCSER